MIYLTTTKCCGLDEIDNLSHSNTPFDALMNLRPEFIEGARWTLYPRPFVMFTGVVDRVVNDHASGRLDNYGQAFADFIVEQGLGQVVASPARVSHSRNTLQVWIWSVDYVALKSWYQVNKVYTL